MSAYLYVYVYFLKENCNGLGIKYFAYPPNVGIGEVNGLFQRVKLLRFIRTGGEVRKSPIPNGACTSPTRTNNARYTIVGRVVDGHLFSVQTPVSAVAPFSRGPRENCPVQHARRISRICVSTPVKAISLFRKRHRRWNRDCAVSRVYILYNGLSFVTL